MALEYYSIKPSKMSVLLKLFVMLFMKLQVA